jgi:hypothetical protein
MTQTTIFNPLLLKIIQQFSPPETLRCLNYKRTYFKNTKFWVKLQLTVSSPMSITVFVKINYWQLHQDQPKNGLYWCEAKRRQKGLST